MKLRVLPVGLALSLIVGMTVTPEQKVAKTVVDDEVKLTESVQQEADADLVEDTVGVSESYEEDEEDTSNQTAAHYEKGKRYISHRTIEGREYSLLIDLRKWGNHATENQLLHLRELFYEVYPQMYDRFGAYTNAPLDVVLVIEDRDEGVAGAGGDTVTIVDKHLENSRNDFDVLSHELVHLIQNGWNGKYLEYDYDSEKFAEYCRYIYAYKDGKYNDEHWELPNINAQNTREKSIRFFVWLDMETSSSNRDIIRDYFEICCDKKTETANWNKAWKNLFKGTKFEGKTIDEVWNTYTKTDFARYAAKAPDFNTKSELLQKTDVRNYIKKHSFSQNYEDSLKK